MEEFVASPEIGLNDLQRAAANALIAKMRHFEKLDDLQAPARVIDHPAWGDVRMAAKRLLDMLGCPEHH